MVILQARVDGLTQPAESASIPINDDGLLRGDGVFEVLRLYDGTPFAVDEHLARLARSAAGLRLPVDLDGALSDILALAGASEGADGLVRLVQTRAGRRIAILEPAPELPPSIRLATIEYSPSGLLDGLKTISYAANSLAGRLAIERDADEALFVTPEGIVLEGPNFAAFFVFGDDPFLTTPPLSEPILDSITRRVLTTLTPIRQRRIRVEELALATEAFVASTVREVLPVAEIDGMALPSCAGPATSAICEAFARHVRTNDTDAARPSTAIHPRSQHAR